MLGFGPYLALIGVFIGAFVLWDGLRLARSKSQVRSATIEIIVGIALFLPALFMFVFPRG